MLATKNVLSENIEIFLYIECVTVYIYITIHKLVVLLESKSKMIFLRILHFFISKERYFSYLQFFLKKMKSVNIVAYLYTENTGEKT